MCTCEVLTHPTFYKLRSSATQHTVLVFVNKRSQNNTALSCLVEELPLDLFT